MLVRELMTESPAVCTPDDEVREAARLMAEHDCGALPVVESGQSRRAKGIITDRDIAVRVVAQGGDPTVVKVGEAMTPTAVTVTPETSAAEAAGLMKTHQVRRLLVMKGATCVGIVALADLARGTSAEEAGQVVKQVSEPTQEPARL